MSIHPASIRATDAEYCVGEAAGLLAEIEKRDMKKKAEAERAVTFNKLNIDEFVNPVPLAVPAKPRVDKLGARQPIDASMGPRAIARGNGGHSNR
jgi:hypothetical protein